MHVRHFPAPGIEAPGTFVIALVADAPQSVDAEWEAYTDRGFLRATFPTLNLDPSPRTPIMLAAHSRAIVIRLPAGTHVYESWLRTVGTLACSPPQGDPRGDRSGSRPVVETIPTPGPSDAPIDAIVAPGLERMDCAKAFDDGHTVTTAAPVYPKGGAGDPFALVRIRVAPDGRLSEASIYRTAGSLPFDQAALRSVAQSTYTAPVAFCRPTFGSYIFRVGFHHP